MNTAGNLTPANLLVENRIAEQFVAELAKALHQNGMASDELEQNVLQLAQQLGLEVSVFATPTSIFFCFGQADHDRTLMFRVTPADIDLGRLNELQTLQRDVVDRRLTVREGRARLPQLLQQSPRYGFWISSLAFAWASGAATILFRGGLNEWMVTLSLGMLIGCYGGLLQRYPRMARTYAPLSALLAALIPYFVGAFLQPLSLEVVTLGSLVVLLPGLTLTIAINELATQNLAAGTARLFGGLVLLMTLGFGVAMGSSLGQQLTATPTGVAPVQLGTEYWYLAIATAPLAFAILFRAQARDFIPITLTCWAGFTISQIASGFLVPVISGAAGSFSVGLIGSIYARLTNRSSSTLAVPGLVFLVPGSIGFRSIQVLLLNDVDTAVRGAFDMFMVAISLVSGLLVAYSLLPATSLLRRND
ncbi:MAG: threonine/serine exporter family protein [Planctomycetaceae bacterium]|nr:threonine/serine exporter family protein [Planctomycetaceae bacterium]